MKKNWIRRFDFLNVPTSLSFKSEYFYQTNLGAILTILLTFFVLLIILYEIIILNKKTSFTLISNQYTDLSQSIDFSKTPILFEFTDYKGKIFDLDNKLFAIEAYQMQMKIEIKDDGSKIRNITNTKLELIKCDKILSNKPEYSALDLTRFICLKPGQNLTSYGLIGDMNNPFKGIRLYINKCIGPNCYDTNEIIKQLNNAKFIVTYLSLSSNIFYLNSENITYQLYSKYFSISTNILKKITFSYDIGRFYLFNNIAFKKNRSLDYIIGNDYSIDIDLDPKSTIQNNEYTLATIAFNYGGRVMETRKDVQTIFEAFSIIGNFFNIIFNIFRVINNYFANKILFVDIFKTIFSNKENIKLNNIKKNINFNNIKSISKNNLDFSEQIYFKNKINQNNSLKPITIKIMPKSGNNIFKKNNAKKKVKNKKNIIKNKLNYFYLLPLWFLKRNKTFKNICMIKDIICNYFCIEKINELIIFFDILEEKNIKSKMSNTELIKINNNYFEKNSLNPGINNIGIIK